MTKAKAIEIAKKLGKLMNEIQDLSFMTTDGCDADKAYKHVEESIDWLLQSSGMSMEEQEKLNERTIMFANRKEESR